MSNSVTTCRIRINNYFYILAAGIPQAMNMNQINQLNQIAALQAQAAQPRPAAATIDPRLQVWYSTLCTQQTQKSRSDFYCFFCLNFKIVRNQATVFTLFIDFL